MSTDSHVDVYAVGVLRDLQQARLYWRHPHRVNGQSKSITGLVNCDRQHHHRHAWLCLRRVFQRPLSDIRHLNFHRLRMSFNGYVAEPQEFPPGDYRRRCGTGWSRKRALKSLTRRLPK